MSVCPSHLCSVRDMISKIRDYHVRMRIECEVQQDVNYEIVLPNLKIGFAIQFALGYQIHDVHTQALVLLVVLLFSCIALAILHGRVASLDDGTVY